MKNLKKMIALALCAILAAGALSFPAQAAGATPIISVNIASVQQAYPEGMICTNTTPAFRLTLRGPGYVMSAQGCWGFAIRFVADLYGVNTADRVPATWLEINKTVSSNYQKEPYVSARECLHIGDILAAVNPSHAMVVIAMGDDGVVLAEGNYGGQVHYGRTLSYDVIDANIAYIFRITPPVTLGATKTECPCSQFLDMPAEWTPEHEAIDWAFSYYPTAITKGTSSSTFSPSDTVTRSQALTFLWRAFGAPEPTSMDCPFVDVDRKAFYYKAVLWGIEKGITNGTSKTTFSPEQNCSRAEIVTFLYAAFGRPSCNANTRYADVKAGKWYDRPAAWARDNGIEFGENGSFHPRTDCTRASTILYIYRALEGRALDYEKP